MNKLLTTKSGFTLVEILVSIAILAIFLPFAANTLTTNRVWSSYTKHKFQAAYAAQQIIENERQATFIRLSAGQSQSTQYSVMLDNKGNYNNNTCNSTTFCGTATVTVTPAVYTNSAGTQTTSSTTDHFVVSISWTEQSYTKPITMTETYAADIVNDTVLN